MSARMIALALNIALMGFLLLRGVRAALDRALPGEARMLDTLAEAVAAGNLPADGPALALSRQALAEGFAGVMLYGALGAGAFAVLSRLVFGRAPAR